MSISPFNGISTRGGFVQGGTDVCLKQEASIGCLLLMLCLDGSVTLFTPGGVDLLVSKKLKKYKWTRSEAHIGIT